MGKLTMPEYDGLDIESLQDKTQEGGVKHNREMGPETRTPPFDRQTRRPEATEPDATMANDLLDEISEPQTASATMGGCELDLTFGVPIQEPPIWVNLYESIRDVFFPPKLPPLKLTSRPIPVPDRMAVKRNPWAVGISATLNVLFLLIMLFFVSRKIINTLKPTLNTTDIDVGEYKALKAKTTAGGGGGGGDHSPVDASKGKLPKFEKNPTTPPQVQTVDHPLLPMEAAINVQKEITLPDNPNMPNIGMKNSYNVKLASNGQGGGGGMGSGYGGGIGSGSGNGYGAGSGGNTGGGLYRIGGSVSAPVLVYHVEAEFSDEARRAKYQGIAMVEIIVDAQGHPQNPRMVRLLGMGLDENAIKAIMQFRFKPAMKDGKTPVPTKITVEVDFHIY
jgi:TonB family protein